MKKMFTGPMQFTPYRPWSDKRKAETRAKVARRLAAELAKAKIENARLRKARGAKQQTACDAINSHLEASASYSGYVNGISRCELIEWLHALGGRLRSPSHPGAFSRARQPSQSSGEANNCEQDEGA